MSNIALYDALCRFGRPEEEGCQGDASNESQPSGGVHHKWAALVPISVREETHNICKKKFSQIESCYPLLEDPNKLRSTCCLPMTRSLGKKVIMVLIERNLYIMIFFAVSHLWIANFSSCWVEACYSLSDPSGILCNCFQFPVRKWELFNHNKIILLIWPSFTFLTSLATCCSNSCLLRWYPR